MSGTPGDVQRRCALIAAALSDGRRHDARLVTGEQRAFGLNRDRTIVNVPFPSSQADWSARNLTCGIALQCSPTKDRVAAYALNDLRERDALALAIIEARVALGWVATHWAG